MEYAPKEKEGKQRWRSFPLKALRGLSDVFEAGSKKYYKFSCLEEFEDPEDDFWDATMRHMDECQVDPLAVDEETGCLHGYQAGWNMIMRTYHMERKSRGA